MPAAEVSKVVRHAVEVVDVTLRRRLERRCFLVEQRRRHERREVEPRQRVLDLGLDLRAAVSSSALRRQMRERTLSLNGPLNEKRLRWMTRIGGSRESVSFFEALRAVLHRGQFLGSQMSRGRASVG